MASIETQSKIGIISKALILIGEAPLISLSDNRYGATVGANLFEMLYENELQSNRWRFACTKEALSQLVVAPLNQWQRAYQLPANMLLPIGVFPKVPYEIYGQRLYTGASSVELDFMFKPDVSRCPAYFSALMTFAMAKHMIKPITESDTAVAIMTGMYNRQRNVAMYADAQGRPATAVMDSPFTDIR